MQYLVLRARGGRLSNRDRRCSFSVILTRYLTLDTPLSSVFSPDYHWSWRSNAARNSGAN